MSEFPIISVVIPVKNDAGILARCLGSLKEIDYPKESLEIIIADGMSRDTTSQTALDRGAKVVLNEKELVVSGRNRGFEAAKGELIAFTDADCVFDKGWLKSSLKYFADELVGGVGGMALQPEDSSDFEKAVDYIFNLAEFFRSTVHRKNLERVREVSDIPGCNAIYRKVALNKVMPVDESLVTAEDVWMNFCIREAGYKLILAPDVILWHYRRNSPKRFLRQIYRFGIGRAQVGKREQGLLSIFHVIIGFAIPLSLLIVTFFYITGAAGLLFKIMLAVFTLTVLLSFLKSKSLKTAVNFPLAFSIFCLGWSAGFLKELILPTAKNEKR